MGATEQVGSFEDDSFVDSFLDSDPLDEDPLGEDLDGIFEEDNLDPLFGDEDLNPLHTEEDLDTDFVEDNLDTNHLLEENNYVEDDFWEDSLEEDDLSTAPLDSSSPQELTTLKFPTQGSIQQESVSFDGNTPYVTSLNFDMEKMSESLSIGATSSGDVDFDDFGDLGDLDDYNGIESEEEPDAVSFREEEIEEYGILSPEETADKAYDESEVKNYRGRFAESYRRHNDRLNYYITLLLQSEDPLRATETQKTFINGSLQKSKAREVSLNNDNTAEIQAQLDSLFRDAASRLNSNVREYTTELANQINNHVLNYKLEFDSDGTIIRMNKAASNGSVNEFFDVMKYAYVRKHLGSEYKGGINDPALDPEFRKKMEDVTSYTVEDVARTFYVYLVHSHHGNTDIEMEGRDLISYISRCLCGCAEIYKRGNQRSEKGSRSLYDTVTRRTFDKIYSDINSLSEIDYGSAGTTLVSGTASSNLHFIMQILKENVRITKRDNSVKETNRYFVYCPTCSKVKEDGSRQRVRIPLDHPLVDLYALSRHKSESFELYLVPRTFKCPCCNTVMVLSAGDLRYIRDDIKPPKSFAVTETNPGFRKYMSNIESVIVPNSFMEFSLGAKKIEKIYIKHGDNALFKSVDSLVETVEVSTDEREEEDEVAYSDYEKYADEEYESASREFWKRLKGFGKASKEVFISAEGKVNDPPRFMQNAGSIFSLSGESVIDEDGNLMNNQAGMQYYLVSSLERRVTNTFADESKLTYKSVAGYLMKTLNIDPVVAKNEALFSLMLRLNSDCLLQNLSTKAGLINAESNYVRMVLLFNSLDEKAYAELKASGFLVSDEVRTEAKNVLPDLIGSVSDSDFETVNALDNLINRISNKQRELKNGGTKQSDHDSIVLASIVQSFLLYRNSEGAEDIALGSRATLNRMQNLDPAYKSFLERAAEFAEGMNGKRLYSRAYHELLHDNKDCILSRYKFLITEELQKIQDLIEILRQSIRPLSFTNIVRTNNVKEYDYNLFVYDDRLIGIIDEITDRMIITNNIGQFYKYWISFDNVPKDLKKAKTVEALQQKLFNVGSQLSNTIIEHIKGSVELSTAECDCLSAATALSLADLNAVRGIANGAKTNSFYDMLRYAVSLNLDNNYFGFQYKSIYKKAAESVRNFAIKIFTSIAASLVDEEKGIVHLTEIQFYLCMAGFTWEEVKKENTTEFPNIKFSMWMVRRRSGESPLDYVNRVNKDDYNKDDKFMDFISMIRNGGVYNDFSIVEMAASLKNIMYENYNASVYMIGMIDIAVNYCEREKGLDLIHFNQQMVNNLVDDLYLPGYTNGSIAIEVLNPSVFSTSLKEVAEFVTDNYKKRILQVHKPLDSSSNYFSFIDYCSALSDTIEKLDDFVGSDLDVGGINSARNAVVSDFNALYNSVSDPSNVLQAELDTAESIISELEDLERNCSTGVMTETLEDLSSDFEEVALEAKMAFDKRNADKKGRSRAGRSGSSSTANNIVYYSLDVEDYQQQVRLIASFWGYSLRQDTGDDYSLVYLVDGSGSDVGFYLDNRFYPISGVEDSAATEDGYNSFLEYRYPEVFFKIKEEDKIVNDVTDECDDSVIELSVFSNGTGDCVGVLNASGLFKEEGYGRPLCTFNEFYSERFDEITNLSEESENVSAENTDLEEDDGSDWYDSEE